MRAVAAANIREVYFVRAKVTGLIKIGVSGDALARLAELRRGCPDELELLAVQPCFEGGILERQLHRQFAHLRVRGEWFKPTKTVMRAVAAARTWRNEWDVALGTEDPRRLLIEQSLSYRVSNLTGDA
jgi:hypothetical protein